MRNAPLRRSIPIVGVGLVFAAMVGSAGCGGGTSSSTAQTGGTAGSATSGSGHGGSAGPTAGSMSGGTSDGRGGDAAGDSGGAGKAGAGGAAGSSAGSSAGGAGMGGAGSGGVGGSSGSSSGGQGGSAGQPGQPEYRGCLTIGGLLHIDIVKIDRAEATCTVVNLQQSTANCGLGIVANGWCLQRASVSADVAACAAGQNPMNTVAATAASGTLAVSSGAMPNVDLDVTLTFPGGAALPQMVDVQVSSCAADCSDSDCRN